MTNDPSTHVPQILAGGAGGGASPWSSSKRQRVVTARLIKKGAPERHGSGGLSVSHRHMS